jgi:peptidoglycan hydrolase-like protein with peptidoglycan-binding domain
VTGPQPPRTEDLTETLKKVQQALKGAGQDPGPIDGRFGPRTQAAIEAFQKSRQLPVTGDVDNPTAEKLGVDIARAGPIRHPPPPKPPNPNHGGGGKKPPKKPEKPEKPKLPPKQPKPSPN